MAHIAVAPAPVNGHKPGSGDQDTQAAFYEQLLQLRDAVLTDKHPRFKLPAPVKERLQSTNVATTSPSSGSFSQLPGLTNGSATSAQPKAVSASHNGSTNGASGARNATAFTQNRGLAPSAGTLPILKPQTSSGIDPIFLTKSDDLIRAETQLQRQRIERHLQDMVNQRMHGQRNRDDEQSAYLMDVSDILQKAHETVKPVSGLHAPAHARNAASDSFDENSYYSSQVNDWSSESARSREAEAAAAADSQAPNVVVHPVATTQKPGDLASSASFSKNHTSKIEHLDKQALPSSHYQDPASYEQETNFYATDTEGVYDAEREDSEEYSPPAAEAFSGADGDADAMDLDDDSSEFVPEEPDVPSPQVPIVTNHLTHIAAPQPARVSPLAVSKLPGLGQTNLQVSSTDRYGRRASPMTHPAPIAQAQPAFRQTSEEDSTSPRQSAQTSPAGQVRKSKRTNKKKRKREVEAATKGRKHREKRMAISPEPYIKPEPLSPPPMSGLSELQPARSRPNHQLPPDVEIVSPQDFRPRQVYYQEPHPPPPAPPPPPPPHYGYTNVPSPTVIRVASPAAYQRPRRDDQDLRRVASLHAAQRPISPQAQAYSPLAPYRTMSQSYAERQAPPTPRYIEQAARPPTVQYIRSERSMSPPQVRVVKDAYTQRMQTPAAMPPPPPPPARKIVVDQYGNRYYANEPDSEPVPAPVTRMSVAPQSRPELDSPYERAPSRATSVFYAPRPVQSAYDDGGQARMAPPPVRRVVLQPETEAPDYHSYRQRDYSRDPEPQYYREELAPVYARETMPPPPPTQRASAYPPDPAASRAFIPRAYSVRPEIEPVRYVTRQPSVALQGEYAPPPPIRAVSVMPGSEYSARPTQVRYDYGQPAPQYPPPAARYLDDETMRASMAPQTRQVYVDQYGREVRQVSGYQ